MDKLIYNSKIFDCYEYSSESEFEKEIVLKINDIFGDDSIYIDV
jgi:hypothetical protein